ncbi:MAG: putative DNA-binding domain-containing protein [Proteobacteria bacterium]|nr:putative DNA-binding domain-containing protein [Pseudomonadota bacterium]
MLLSRQQAAFADAIWHGDAAPAIGMRPARRLAIYRNNVFASLAGVLAARFPVIRRLVGDVCFQGCCLRFVAEHPPLSPVLAEYGAGFAAFLTALPELADLRYLADVARLEWACHEVLHSADAPVLRPEMLAGIAAERVPDLVFHVHPGTRLLSADYPIHTIWRTNMFDAETGPVSADMAGEAVLISRRDEQVSVLPLPPAAFVFVQALLSGSSLGDAAMAGEAADESFALAPSLAALLQAEAFTDYNFKLQRTVAVPCS